ncbi:hypothetical protein DEU34_2180 [Microbacterium sp. AG1240]|uniref:hypothetical protein n=1 Tax=Microbacterium sp. AG1240 TaxID=2183992 RepID=UPI000EB09FC0|nr:hypothetical protein [Microbacterium sp. AG1240]RKT33578.1 hypothetical protein DEU34_2180 [Microbacterium sp. AG1240]
MTRAQAPDGELEFRSFGAAGAARTVLVLRVGAVAMLDPGPSATLDHDVRLMAVQLDEVELDDPPTYRGETPAASTAAALADLVRREVPGAVIGLVAERDAVPLGVALAASAGELVDRLALVDVRVPDSALVGDLLADEAAAVVAPSIVVSAPGDDTAARWYADRLGDGEVRVVEPGGDGLSLTRVWDVVLGHVAAQPAEERASGVGA